MSFFNNHGAVVHFRHVVTPRKEGRENTFVFINSLGTDFRIWENVSERLMPFGDLLLYDKRGHGLSDAVPATTTLDDFADDAEALMDYLNIRRTTVVGLSVGGMIAQILAGRNPERISSLVLCDTRHKIGNAQTWNERIATVQAKGLAAISEGVMQRWFGESFRRENATLVSGYRNMLERQPPSGYVQTCKAIRDADLTEIARQITTPALCVVGSEDKSTLPEEVKNLADLIEGSRFEVIRGSGHIPCVDNPGVLSNLIIDFLNEQSTNG